MIDRKKSIIV